MMKCWLLFSLPLLVFTQLFAAETRPNVLLFLVDDLGVMDTELRSGEFYETPNLRKLAARGPATTR